MVIQEGTINKQVMVIPEEMVNKQVMVIRRNGNQAGNGNSGEMARVNLKYLSRRVRYNERNITFFCSFNCVVQVAGAQSSSRLKFARMGTHNGQ